MHAGSAAWLAARTPKRRGGRTQAGTSIDQIVARSLGKETQLASLELSLESPVTWAAVRDGYSCVYVNTIAWRDADDAAADGEQSARGLRAPVRRGRTAAGRRRDVLRDESILEGYRERSRPPATRRLGARNRWPLDEYHRSGSRAWSSASAGSKSTTTSRRITTAQSPSGIPESLRRARHGSCSTCSSFAYRSDITRVHTFQYDRGSSACAVIRGSASPTHTTASRTMEAMPRTVAGYVKINTYRVRSVRRVPRARCGPLPTATARYSITRSSSTAPEWATATYAPGAALVLVGGGGGRLRGGRHLHYELAPTAKMSNLFVTLLEMVGATGQTVGDSTGVLPELWSSAHGTITERHGHYGFLGPRARDTRGRQ